jgi:hypothetical protein
MCRARQTLHPVAEFATFHRSGSLRLADFSD